MCGLLVVAHMLARAHAVIARQWRALTRQPTIMRKRNHTTASDYQMDGCGGRADPDEVFYTKY
eukprot:COSAG02_NODE_3519_length_6620_cov_7.023923_3_plen_63_part_00